MDEELCKQELSKYVNKPMNKYLSFYVIGSAKELFNVCKL